MTDYTEIEKLALEEVNKHAKIYEEAALFNTAKVMKAFRSHMVSDFYLKFLKRKQRLYVRSLSAVRMRWQLRFWACCAQATK